MTTYTGKGANAYDLEHVLINFTLSILFMIYEQKKMFEGGFATVHKSLRNIIMIHSTSFRILLRDFIFMIFHYTLTLINAFSMPFHWHKKKRD
jgi:hypothetical protein